MSLLVKNIINPLIFDRVIAISLVSSFLGRHCTFIFTYSYVQWSHCVFTLFNFFNN